MRAPARAALACAAACLAAPAAAGERPWYAPDHATLQLAGNVGFLSPGAGWGLGRSGGVEVLFGWVPEGIGGTDIFSVTAKGTWAPWSVQAGRWTVEPVTAAVQATYTFGRQYFVVPRFPFTPTAIRTGLGVGASAGRDLGGRRATVYGEFVALDVPLVLWLTNRGALGPQDVFSLALGVRLEL